MVQVTVPTVTLTASGGGLYSVAYNGFTEAGPYRVVVHAQDDEGLIARPKAIGEQHRLYLPLLLRAYTPAVRFPVKLGDAIPQRAVTTQGEVFYSAAVRMPDTLPEGGRFYLSAAPDAVAAVVVDDELALLVAEQEVLSYRFSSEGVPPEPAVVEVPRATMAQLVGQTATVVYQDVYGSLVSASAMWLIWVP